MHALYIIMQTLLPCGVGSTCPLVSKKREKGIVIHVLVLYIMLWVRYSHMNSSLQSSSSPLAVYTLLSAPSSISYPQTHLSSYLSGLGSGHLLQMIGVWCRQWERLSQTVARTTPRTARLLSDCHKLREEASS